MSGKGCVLLPNANTTDTSRAISMSNFRSNVDKNCHAKNGESNSHLQRYKLTRSPKSSSNILQPTPLRNTVLPNVTQDEGTTSAAAAVKLSSGIAAQSNSSSYVNRRRRLAAIEAGSVASPASSQNGINAKSHDAETDTKDSKDKENLYNSAQHARFEEEEKNFECTLIHQRNQRVLLTKLQDAVPRGRLALINLTRRGLGISETQLLCQAVILNPFLSVLKLAYNALGDEGTFLLATALNQNGHHQGLSLLDLSFNSIHDSGAEALALNVLAGNFCIKSLGLSGNCIRESGALAIMGALIHGSGLQALYLSHNKLGTMGTKAIVGAIAKNNVCSAYSREGTLSNITELHLCDTGMQSDGFTAIPVMLTMSTSLKSLSLSGNGLEDADILLLAQALARNKEVPIETLVLSNNNITCQGVENLMNAVWGSSTLKCLRLDNNRMQDRGAQLCAVVLTSISLEILDISFNRVSTVGIKALMKNVSENNSLQYLSICGINIDQNGAKAVSFALAYNATLRVVHFDSCGAGYAAQRHIVAGIVSNQSVALRVFTGFALGQIAKTLGMPFIPDSWSNVQLLGFVRMMWEQWSLKSGRGVIQQSNGIRGPAPPAAVATAGKIAFASLGTNVHNLFVPEAHEISTFEAAPVDPPNTSFIERTASGTLQILDLADGKDDEVVDEWTDRSKFSNKLGDVSNQMPLVRPPSVNNERRGINLQWLRNHFQPLTDIGKLPFNNADLWQLHQYYYSPPTSAHANDGGELTVSTNTDDVTSATTSLDDSSVTSSLLTGNSQGLGRTISFQSLNNAIATAAFLTAPHNKRPLVYNIEDDSGHVSKKVKNQKPRIAYYPRIMAKIETLGSRPMSQTLSLLRRLKYVESVMFAGTNPHTENMNTDSNPFLHTDVEMILLDLL